MGKLLLPAFLAMAVAGCAPRGHRSEPLDPFLLPDGAPLIVSIRVNAVEAADRKHAADLERLIPEALRRHKLLRGAAPPASGTELDIQAKLLSVAPGGSWGEEAECHVEISLRISGSGAAAGRFKAIGYSGSTWERDRIPGAIEEAAEAVAEYLLKVASRRTPP